MTSVGVFAFRMDSIGDQRRKRVAAQKLFDYDEIERVAAQRHRAQAVQIEHAQTPLRNSAIEK